MENQKNNKGVIVLLIVIIVILLALCVLFATGTISFNSNKVNNNEINNSENTDNNESNNNDSNSQTSDIKAEDIKKIFKVAYDYYAMPRVYCGKKDHNIVKINGTDRYTSTEFSTYEEMLNSLKKYMSVEVISGKTPWAATTQEYYLEQDGKLYCEVTYKGYMYGHGNIDVEITSQTENKVNCIATMELTDPSEDKTYDKVNLVLEKVEGTWIITSYKK